MLTIVNYAKKLPLLPEKSFQDNEFDNKENVKRIVELRHKRANLLGYKSHSDFVLEERMAQNPEKVLSFK
jgi:peptidyl-dipeptidase Dcp